MEKEIFLREKMFSLYIFALKTTLTLSSSSLAFSIGILSFSTKSEINNSILLVLGWIFLILSIIWSISVINSGIVIYNKYLNNIQIGSQEFSNTSKIEDKIGRGILICFSFF